MKDCAQYLIFQMGFEPQLQLTYISSINILKSTLEILFKLISKIV